MTLAGANRRLPLVRKIAADIVALSHDLADREDRLKILRRRGRKQSTGSFHSDELDSIEEIVQRDQKTLEHYVAELSEVGGELRDASLGIVEFRGDWPEHDGPVFFGWLHPNDEITYWRPERSKLTDRRSVFEDSVAGREEFGDADSPESNGNTDG
ncbi:hypothetical protein Pan189_17860 [Stratiformator vulcanicus]|uniref:DUF2203 domain-containing protein n=2 Tax=Stratiformator vulcanicus TaxID=2527980 RepID=A0A517R0I1_9PLAN|nr:hypothetical protein Pan189_17860 [Stratiformator vulcanicus]